MALCDVISLMELIKDMRESKFDIVNTDLHVLQDFHDSVHALSTSMYAIITFESMKGLIKIFPMDTKDQIADTLTKALAQNDFVCQRKLMCGQ
eukprot:CCRYP_013751-RA/>CCRYP_013751-RA protein AED:0.34 eAED:0.47 QI:0/0/0/1/0/0/3/0/92